MAAAFLDSEADPEPPRIFEYLDYREYLDCYFAFRKSQDRNFSLRTFSRLPGLALSSSSFISAVLMGRKNLRQNLRIRFGRAMDLKPGELEYFELLIQFNQSKSTEERHHYFRLLSRFHGSKARVLHEGQHRFYAHWYYGAVWNYFGIHPDRNNPALIGKSLLPPLSPHQVEDAIRVLLDLKLIKKMANGYAVTDRHLATGKAFRGSTARQHHREYLALAMESMERAPAEDRRLHVLSFSVSRPGLERMMARMDSFRAELREILAADTGEDRIYALALQLFPCSVMPAAERGIRESKEGRDHREGDSSIGLDGKGAKSDTKADTKSGTTVESGNPEL